MTSPVPGFVPQQARTWQAGDPVTVPRLRADAWNLAALFTAGRPVAVINQPTQQTIPFNTVTNIFPNATLLNTWNVAMTPISGTPSAEYFPAPLAGWYLIQGAVGQRNTSTSSVNDRYSWGITTVINGNTTTTDLGACTAPDTPGVPTGYFGLGNSGAELVELNPGTGDKVAYYAYSSAGSGATLVAENVQIEWVALPSQALPNSGVPVGTVVRNPVPAQMFPPGPGGTLNASVAAGGSVLAINPIPGLRAGQVIGLDYQAGFQAQPVAEAVTVGSVTSGTVTLSGSVSYAHSAGAPVAVPVSAPFLNEQVRDITNFGFYPPILRAYQITSGTQLVGSTSFPTAVQITNLTATVDNFSGFSNNTYTVPVTGTYLVCGIVYFVGTTSPTVWGAAIKAGGTTYWGDVMQSDTSSVESLAPTVRKLVRLTAGQTIQLFGFQNSGSSQQTRSQGATFSRLIVVFRSF